jgi:hypothetical protein
MKFNSIRGFSLEIYRVKLFDRYQKMKKEQRLLLLHLQTFINYQYGKANTL